MAEAYERDDGLFDVEVDMSDVKPYSFDNTDRDYVAAGEPLHHMKMRVTINEQMEIVDVEARTLASPFNICSDVTPQYKKLVGVRIAGGFTKQVQEITGRTAGCTHHNDILKVVGTTAFQALWSVLARRRRERAKIDDLQDDKTVEKVVGKNPAQALIGTCHAYAPSSSVVKRQWPELHVPKLRESK